VQDLDYGCCYFWINLDYDCFLINKNIFIIVIIVIFIKDCFPVGKCFFFCEFIALSF